MDKNFLITKNKTIKHAMEQINLNKHKCIVVVDKSKKMLGTLSDGDIRGAILKSFKLDSKISQIFNRKAKFIFKKYCTDEKLKKLFLTKNYDIIPILDKNKKVVDVTYWSKIFKNNFSKKSKIDIPVVVMAGGEGTRMRPFTHILPKPLIPINDKPVIEHIMEKFVIQGLSNFIFTINHKAEIMKAFFKEMETTYKIKYLEEKKPLGTIGSIRLLKNKIKKNFFVINCDTIINIDYKEVLNFHIKKKNVITIIACAKEYEIPYGICKTNNSGQLKKLTEKPKMNFLANSGAYMFDPKIINLIPAKKKFDVNELVILAKKKKMKVGVFPIGEGNWFDVGQWGEYKKTINSINNND